MLATGCRIGDALALRYGNNGDGKPTLVLEAGTLKVIATVVRVPGAGLTVQPRPKTTAGWRVIALPESAVRMLEDRRASSRWQTDAQVVFPPPLTGTLRDPSNVSGDLRQLPPLPSGSLRNSSGAVLLEPSGLSSSRRSRTPADSQ